MLALSSAALLVLLTTPAWAQKAAPLEQIKVRIDANEWNRPKLLEKLNRNGLKNGMKFVSATEGYDYRIDFKTGKTSETVIVKGTGGSTDYDTGFATVYDSQGAEMFQIKHEAFWSEEGAMNGAAKEIIKRLKKLRSERKNQ